MKRRSLLLAAGPVGLLGAMSTRRPAAEGAFTGGLDARGAEGWPGGLDGVWHWRLPDTPNGLKPSQSWHATGSAPDGAIYVGGMDHATNSALYRLSPRDGTLRLVGDARSASEAAGNWLPGETAQKFHTRPLWLGGKVYVATMDRSALNDEHLSRRGFHWYAYDPANGSFTDLSAAEPGGTGAPHGALVTLAGDPSRDLVYGAGVPTGAIFRYDVASGRTENLGRPGSFDRPYVYANRIMWLDARGRLYFTAGNPREGSHDASIYGHVHYHDPDRGGFGERRDWSLREPRALEVGQCVAALKACFFADDQGHVYRFQDGDAPSWGHLGRAELPTATLFVWVFHATADGKKAYLATSAWGEAANPSSLYEFDLLDGRTRRLCGFAELGPEISRRRIHTGYDAWDGEGRFYFTSFSDAPDENVLLTRIDPVRLKVAVGALPSLTEVAVDRAPGTATPTFVFTRAGSVGGVQEVRYRLVSRGNGQITHEHHGAVTIPRGAASVGVALGDLSPGTPVTASGGTLSVVAGGNDYVVGARRDVEF